MSQRIFIFDVDGVLLQPNGYRAATAECLRYFFRLMNLVADPPDESVTALYESLGITCEWDHVPLGLAAVLNAAAGGSVLPVDNLAEAIDWAASQKPVLEPIDYAGMVAKLPRYLVPGEGLSDSLAAVFGRGETMLFPGLSRELLLDLFARTRDVVSSPTTSVFQAYVLGPEVYAHVYRQPAPVKVPSYLERMDRPLIDGITCGRLLAGHRAGRVFCTAMTARYSLPPLESADAFTYSPEAEMALNLTGLAEIPLLGYGSVHYLAEKVGFIGERLLKPVPVQALACMAAASGLTRWDALCWAYQMVAGREGYLDLPAMPTCGSEIPPALAGDLDVHVFEDSPIGVRACQGAVEILREHGVNARLQAWGITSHTGKAMALAALGARVVPDVNQAIEIALDAGMWATP